MTLRDFLVSYESQSAQDELIQKKNVEWALNTSSDRERTESASSNATSSVSSSLDAYEKKLADIFGNPATPNEKLFVSIEKEFDSEALNSKLFIRALAIQLIKSCYSDKLDTTEFQKRKDILIKYINKREDIELEVLYAIQALDHRLQHPAGMSLNIVNYSDYINFLNLIKALFDYYLIFSTTRTLYQKMCSTDGVTKREKKVIR